jgi:hypothetical protein
MVPVTGRPAASYELSSLGENESPHRTAGKQSTARVRWNGRVDRKCRTVPSIVASRAERLADSVLAISAGSAASASSHDNRSFGDHPARLPG